MTEVIKPVRVLTSTQMAEQLGIDRSTLVRLEQKGILSKAPVVGKPINGRVYDEALARTVTAEYRRHAERQRMDLSGRPTPPKVVIPVDRF